MSIGPPTAKVGDKRLAIVLGSDSWASFPFI